MMLKLKCSEEDKTALLKTMEAYSKAFEMAAEWGFSNRITNKFEAQKGVYRIIREFVPKLNSSLVQTAIHCSCEALKGGSFKRRPNRRDHAAMRYTKKTARIVFNHGFVSLATVIGRRKISFDFPTYFKNKFEGCRVISSTISFRRSSVDFYIGIVVEKIAPILAKGGEFLGIDRGLKNIVVTSDNRFFDSRRLNSLRGHHAHTRATLQAKGTRSAKRRLRSHAGRERRFIACENHAIAKMIVISPCSNFVLEDLTGISSKRKRNPNLTQRLNQWPFRQLEDFISYKAEDFGKHVIMVPPEMTSITCSRCGFSDKENRISHILKCKQCGYEINIDLNAARNIANLGKSLFGRLNANQPDAPCDDVRTLEWDSGVTERRCERYKLVQLALRGGKDDEFLRGGLDLMVLR
jgi:putative transposase